MNWTPKKYAWHSDVRIQVWIICIRNDGIGVAVAALLFNLFASSLRGCFVTTSNNFISQSHNEYAACYHWWFESIKCMKTPCVSPQRILPHQRDSDRHTNCIFYALCKCTVNAEGKKKGATLSTQCAHSVAGIIFRTSYLYSLLVYVWVTQLLTLLVNEYGAASNNIRTKYV